MSGFHKMATAHHLDPIEMKFSIFTSEEIRKLSVAKIVATYTYDILGNPYPGGLYDLAMGPGSSTSEPCATCQKSFVGCSGHMGHIELPIPVFNPFFKKVVQNFLRIICLHCYEIQISKRVQRILKLQLRLINAGYTTVAQEIEIFKSDFITESCPEKVLTSDGISVHPKIIEYENMLSNCPINKMSSRNKNVESLISVIINSTLRESITKKCIHCEMPMKKIQSLYGKLVIGMTKKDIISFYNNSLNSEDATSKMKSTSKTILAEECRNYFREAYKNCSDIIKLLFPILENMSPNSEYPTDIFFIEVLPVLPPSVRPSGRVRNAITEHGNTNLYRDVISANIVLNAIIANVDAFRSGKDNIISDDSRKLYDTFVGSTPHEKLYNAIQDLQTKVNLILDTSTDRMTRCNGLKQIIEKKQGIIRKNMMGKRVDFAARTVITPDPYIGVDEIGVPELFAQRLTYPIPVTPWNVKSLRLMVLNGPDNYPGANFIEYSNGNKVKIPTDSETKRASLAKLLITPIKDGIKIIHRQLLNGDVLMLNRQPTLHRNSIQGHKARILKGDKVFRLHYSNCKAYNADFDGDEMNAHFPQNELARSEAYNIANVANNYTVPKDGTPLGGLIQDHVIAGVSISMRGKFFNREDYQQLVFQALSTKKGDVKLLPPSIIKPVRLWSGKQVFSTIILNSIPTKKSPINLTSTAKISTKEWQKFSLRQWKSGGSVLEDNEMTESEVVIREGELLVGVLDKMHYGATPYGLIHCVYEIYGGECAVGLLSSFTRCFTLFLQWEGFTLGVKDILVIQDADLKRKQIIADCRSSGNKIAVKALNLPFDTPQDILNNNIEDAYAIDQNFRGILDRSYKSALDNYTNQINKECIPIGLITKFPENNLQLMIQSGAKGSAVNAMQISCLLGQIELEGKRPPLMISGKSLPSFTNFETSPKSGGFIDGRFLTGIQPQDFFFHCMAGREGLIDTAVKTSRSGYLQRCLIKHLEGLNVNYDLTVRDSDNSVIQFLYGEDGMDISRATFLKQNQMKFLYDNCCSIKNPDLLEQLKNNSELEEKIIKHKRKIRSWLKKNKKMLTGFQQFSKDVKDEISIKKPNKVNKNTGRCKIDQKIIKKWLNLTEDLKLEYLNKSKKCPDPVITKYSPDNNFGSITEYLEKILKKFSKTHPKEKHDIAQLLYIKSSRALVDPGEPVGLLAAQSIGEPSTQMTLNTFHFAGRGEMNVTLGIPRLREILMMASRNIKTPSMDIPFLSVTNIEELAEKLRLKMMRVTVADVLENITVKSNIKLRPNRVREYTLRFKFLPRDAYNDKFLVKPKQIIQYMSRTFFPLMFKAIVRAAKEKNSIVDVGEEKKSKKKILDDEEDIEIDEKEPQVERRKKGVVDSSDDDDDDVNQEGDDALEKLLRNKKNDENDYDDSDSEMESDKEENLDDILDSDKEDVDVEIETAAVLENNEFTESYTYDTKHFLWCELRFCLVMKYPNLDLSTLLKEVARKSVVAETPNIRRAITYMKDDSLILKTDGINIHEMFKYNKILNINQLYTNDIHGMAKKYGIEAARQVLVNEVKNVFKVYGIDVDIRHLYLIADYMTFDGTYKAMNRTGMDNSSSPLQQISFESSLKFLTEATVAGRTDNLDSPSGRLMVGQPCKSGTGAFSLITDYNCLLKYMQS